MSEEERASALNDPYLSESMRCMEAARIDSEEGYARAAALVEGLDIEVLKRALEADAEQAPPVPKPSQ